jgi:chromosomal replication initiator protein
VVSSVASLSFLPETEDPSSCNARTDPNSSDAPFFLGTENALLFQAFDSIASRPAPYCPVVLSGPPGVGKSHFLRGIVTKFRAQFPQSTSCFVTGGDFARGFATAVELDSIPEFRQQHRTAELLVLDDLDELTRKRTAQIELLNSLDYLISEQRHVFVASRTAVNELEILPGLKSRLASGLTIPVVAPAAETRRVIIEQLARDKAIPIAEEVAELLATGTAKIPSPLATVPQIRAAVLELGYGGSSDARPINKQAAVDFISGRTESKKPSIREIKRLVARSFCLSVSQLGGSSRQRGIVHARGIAIYLARTLTGGSYQQIGAQFGGRDHTTVMHAYRRTQTVIDSDPETRRIVDQLNRKLCGHGSDEVRINQTKKSEEISC